MDVKAILKAGRRLELARKQLESADDSNTFEEFEEYWYLFLVCAKSAYTALKKGSHVNPQSRQWFGKINDKRKKDPFLQYFFHARDDDEHGLGRVLAPMGVIGMTHDAFEQRNGILMQRMVSPHDQKPKIFGVLAPVTARDSIVYQPPTDMELGCMRKEDAPRAAGEKFISYLEDLLEEAGERVA